jgi:hypothetical protein
MAGILANSPSKTMVSGDAGVDQSVTGFITGERIVLGAVPAGVSYSWGLSVPAESAVARSRLSDSTAAAPTFTPDVTGVYVLTLLVDGTTYVLRLSVRQVAISQFSEVLRFTPIADSQVPAPALGRAVYFSETQGALVEKRPDGSVHVITTV